MEAIFGVIEKKGFIPQKRKKKKRVLIERTINGFGS